MQIFKFSHIATIIDESTNFVIFITKRQKLAS
uniref:Uncharacterized protein n=1 Tax=Rhizophora mucronata TaxID=61149 RepID=A0A2P2N5H9_RHIMU